jgi:hypothetical protein
MNCFEGPWIIELEYGYNNQFIEEAHTIYKKKYESELNFTQVVPFSVTHSFIEKNGLNGVALEGLEEIDVKTKNVDSKTA